MKGRYKIKFEVYKSDENWPSYKFPVESISPIGRKSCLVSFCTLVVGCIITFSTQNRRAFNLHGLEAHPNIWV